jgi:D-alanine-D-alanine ligase
MKITVLTHLEREQSKRRDIVVDQVRAALEQRGHHVSVLGVHGDVRKLITGLNRRQPDLVFNLMEMFGRNLFGDVGVAGLLELLNLPYTGVGPGECYLQQDKVLTKKLLAYEGLRYPDFVVFSPEAGLETGGKLHMPLFVKPLRADASIGIDGHSLVHNPKELLERALAIQQHVHDAALAEEYIAGREFYVGILGNENPLAFPPLEMDFSGLPPGKPHVLDSKAKWAKDSIEYEGTRAVVADLADELRARLHQVSLDAYHALRVRDYGRIDLRLSETGDIYVIEVNANCYLEQNGEFATAAAAGGIDYPELIGRIADCARKRFRRREKISV